MCHFGDVSDSLNLSLTSFHRYLTVGLNQPQLVLVVSIVKVEEFKTECTSLFSREKMNLTFGSIPLLSSDGVGFKNLLLLPFFEDAAYKDHYVMDIFENYLF